MKIQFSDTNWATEKIIKLFKRNSDRSLSAVFRRFRKSPFLDLIGDYPLLFHIVDTASSFGINFSRQKLLYAFNQSNELSKLPKGEKNSLLNQLLEQSYDQLKEAKIRQSKFQNVTAYDPTCYQFSKQSRGKTSNENV